MKILIRVDTVTDGAKRKPLSFASYPQPRSRLNTKRLASLVVRRTPIDGRERFYRFFIELCSEEIPGRSAYQLAVPGIRIGHSDGAVDGCVKARSDGGKDRR